MPAFSSLLATFTAAATAAPQLIPHNIPSSFASRRAISNDSSSVTCTTSSITFTFSTSGMNPAPSPWILCGPGVSLSFGRPCTRCCVSTGLAVGSTAAAAGSSVHGGDVWYLAVAALTLQTCRHMVDFAFGASKRRVPPEPIPVLPLAAPDDRVLDEPEPPARSRPRGGGLGNLAVWLSGRSEKVRVLHWFKKIIVLPIGERFALIALTAALCNAKVTFVALLSWGAVAAAYTIGGRFLRSLTQPRAAHVDA